MEYRIDLGHRSPALAPLDAAVRSFDPAAVMDVDADSGELRVATDLPRTLLVHLLAGAGLVVPDDAVRTKPSTCCGGCGG